MRPIDLIRITDTAPSNSGDKNNLTNNGAPKKKTIHKDNEMPRHMPT